MSKRPGGIDYSKWDHIDVSDSEEEEDTTPRVTTLDGPSRVTRQADGTLVVEESSSNTDAKPTSKAITSTQKQQERNYKEEWTRNGACLLDGKFYWSQDRHQVVFRYRLEKGTFGKDVQVQVKGALPYSERTMAVSTTELPHFSILVKNKTVLEGTLPHVIHLDENEEKSCVDWLVEESSCKEKFVVVTLNKASPAEGVTLWWKQPLKKLPERPSDKEDSSKLAEKQQRFQEAWDEAHKQFRAKTENKKQSRS